MTKSAATRKPESPQASSAGEAARRRMRGMVAVSLVVLATLGLVLSPIAWWVRTTLLDTDAFVAVVEPTLTSDEVASALADIVADQAITALDLDARLQARLGAFDQFIRDGLADVLDVDPAQRRLLARIDLPEFASLAAPIAAGVESRIERATQEVMRSDVVRQTLPAAVGRAHATAVAILREDETVLPNVAVVDGDVRWDAAGAVAAVIRGVIGQRLDAGVLAGIEIPDVGPDAARPEVLAALEEGLGTVLPDGFGQVTIVHEDTLQSAQRAVQLLDRSVWGVIAFSLLAAASAVAVSSNRRRTIVQLAIGAAAGLVFVALLRRTAVDAVLAEVADPERSAAAGVVADQLFSGLQQITAIVILVLIIVGLVAFILGRPGWLERVTHPSSGSAPARLVAQHRDAAVMLGLALALLAWWQVGVGFISVLVVGGLLLAYLLWVAGVRRRPDPDATRSVDEGRQA